MRALVRRLLAPSVTRGSFAQPRRPHTAAEIRKDAGWSASHRSACEQESPGGAGRAVGVSLLEQDMARGVRLPQMRLKSLDDSGWGFPR